MRSWDLLGRTVLGVLEARARSRGLRGDTATIDLRQAIVDQANAQGVPPAIALAVAMRESDIMQWRADGSLVTSSAGAIGIMQLMPATAAQLGVDPADPLQNIQGGVAYLRQMYDRYGDWPTGIAAYNMGPKNADYNVSHGVPIARWKNFATYVAPILAAAGVGSIAAEASYTQQPAQTFAPDNGGASAPPLATSNNNGPLILFGMAATILGVQWLLE